LFDILFDPNSPFIWIIIILIILFVIAIFSRSFSTYVKFVYPNAKFEAIGNPFVTELELNKLIEKKDLESLKETLNQTKDYKISGDSIKDIQKSLDDVFIKNVNMMKKDSSKKMNIFFDSYLEKIDSSWSYFGTCSFYETNISDIDFTGAIIDNLVLKETTFSNLKVSETFPVKFSKSGKLTEVTDSWSLENLINSIR